MKNKSKGIIIKNILIIIAILIIVTICLILIQIDFFKLFEKSEPVLFVLNDECSSILNQIIHQISDESGCKIKCISECEIRNLEYHDSEFIIKNTSICHTCNCYCI